MLNDIVEVHEVYRVLDQFTNETIIYCRDCDRLEHRDASGELLFKRVGDQSAVHQGGNIRLSISHISRAGGDVVAPSPPGVPSPSAPGV